MNDVFITSDEIKGLMENRLYVEWATPSGSIKLSDWVKRHAGALGKSYASELAKRR